MAKDTIIVGVVIENDSVSFIDVCEGYNITEQQLLEMLEYGLIPTIDTPSRQQEFDRDMLTRIKTALRLQADLDLNISGVVLAMELMDELEELNQELDILKKHMHL